MLTNLQILLFLFASFPSKPPTTTKPQKHTWQGQQRGNVSVFRRKNWFRPHPGNDGTAGGAAAAARKWRPGQCQRKRKLCPAQAQLPPGRRVNAAGEWKWKGKTEGGKVFLQRITAGWFWGGLDSGVGFFGTCLVLFELTLWEIEILKRSSTQSSKRMLW